mmetsp:Transcript_5406/g.17918  ORF Transcript_5406/g.17918 Transcript_5406/m.17918 type:complete len:202 (-) Transcript_5406:806-1411(-)
MDAGLAEGGISRASSIASSTAVASPVGAACAPLLAPLLLPPPPPSARSYASTRLSISRPRDIAAASAPRSSCASSRSSRLSASMWLRSSRRASNSRFRTAFSSVACARPRSASTTLSSGRSLASASVGASSNASYSAPTRMRIAPNGPTCSATRSSSVRNSDRLDSALSVASSPSASSMLNASAVSSLHISFDAVLTAWTP